MADSTDGRETGIDFRSSAERSLLSSLYQTHTIMDAQERSPRQTTIVVDRTAEQTTDQDGSE